MTLSTFLQKLLFINRFTMTEGKIDILNNRYIMLGAGNLLALQNLDTSKMYSIAKNSSRDQMKLLVEHAGVYKTLKTSELKGIAELSKKIGQTDEGVMKTLQTIFEMYGLGKLFITNLDNQNFRVNLRITDSTLALEQRKIGLSENNVCTLTSGILAGIFTYIFNKDVNCVEQQCLATGKQTCEFTIS